MSIKQDLLEGIEFIVKNYIENAPFDKTRVGIIQGVSSNNAYTVKIDNRIFNNVPYLGNGTLGLNTTVRVVVPENQMNNIIILGTTQKEDTPIVVAVSSVNGKTGDVVLNIGDIPNLNKTLEQKYSALNPPPYPVKSINGLTGEVVLFIPSKTSQLLNDSDYQNSTQMNTAISMEASNRKSADDSLQAQIANGNSDILNLQNTKANKTEVPTKVSQLLNDSGFLTSIPNEYTTNTEMQAYAQPKGDYATNMTLNKEVTNLQNADNTLQQNIDNINNKVDNLQSVQILNKGVINSIIANVQNICSNYIVTEYGRQPKNLDGLIITLTDSTPPNDKVQYVYSGFSNVWVDIGSAQIEITEGSKTEKGVLQVGEGISVTSGVISTDKTMIGLTNVDNTSDLNKPLSTATRNALNLKANSADLSIVATSGSYNDLLNKPMTLPASDVYSWAKEPNKPTYTASEVGLGNVPNVTTNDQTPTYTDTTTFATLTSGEKLSVAFAKIKLAITNLINHIANVSNPHNVTKTQVGLGNVDNTSDANKPISTATQTALNSKAPINNPTFTGTVSGITKSMIGLGNVDNTADNVKNVASAVKATQDASGNVITTTYATKSQIPTSLPPNGTAGGDLTGTYPNPTIGSGKVAKAKLETSVQTSLNKADTALQSIPIGGTNIGGVKNGGNVTISSDGTMNTSGTGEGDMLKSQYATKSNTIVDTAYNSLSLGGKLANTYILSTDAGSAVDPNPINADTLGGYPASAYVRDSSGGFLKPSDVVNNLTSESIDKPLSAKQGNVLNTTIESLNTNKAPINSPNFTGTPTVVTNTNYTTRQLRNVIFSTVKPTSADGQNGDIWIIYGE